MPTLFQGKERNFILQKCKMYNVVFYNFVKIENDRILFSA